MTLTPEAAAAKIDAALLRLQLFAEARMRWRCRVERQSASDAPWERGEDGIDRPPTPLVIYRGMFRMRTFLPHESTPDAGGATVTLVRTNAHLPAVDRIPALAAAGKVEADLPRMPFREGDLIIREVGGVDVARYRVASPHDITDQTAQRLLVDEGA